MDLLQLSSHRYNFVVISATDWGRAGATHGCTELKMDWSVIDAGNGVTLVAVKGRMDVAGSLKVDPVFAEQAGQTAHMIVDLSELDFLASLGIRTLVTACKTLHAKNGGMVVFAPQQNVEDVLRSSGIDTIIPIAPDRASAEAQVKS
jgi:anti-sigma B factor antagonist